MARKKPPTTVGPHGPMLGQLDAAEVSWLVPGVIPLGTLTALTGPSDMGKSVLCCALAADSAGGPRLDLGRPRRVGPALWYTSEENPASMIRPRLLAAGCPAVRLPALMVPVPRRSPETVIEGRHDKQG